MEDLEKLVGKVIDRREQTKGETNLAERVADLEKRMVRVEKMLKME